MMFKTLLAVLTGLAMALPALGVELVVEQDSIVIEGGTYDAIDMTGRSFVTLRNVTVDNQTGTEYYAGIKVSGCKSIVIDNCEVNGRASTCGAIKFDGTTKSIARSNVLHNCNDDGFRLYQSHRCEFYDNEIYHLLGQGTDNGGSTCNNGHSDGFQIIGCWDVEVHRNLCYDIVSTSCFHSHGTSRWVNATNNLFYGPALGLPAYMYQTEGGDFHNNVVWGRDQGSYGGFALGSGLYDFRMYNNIMLNLNTSHLGFTYNAAEHEGDYNLFGEASTGVWPRGSHSIIADDPGFQGLPAKSGSPIYGSGITRSMFELKSSSPAINAGTTTDETPKRDYYRALRDATPDMGGIEYGTSGNIERVWFTAANRQGEAPLNVTFSNTSPASFTSWAWDFGDGTTSSAKEPSHTYTDPGKYDVTLAGFGSAGGDTLEVRFYIVATAGSGVDDAVKHAAKPSMDVFPNPVSDYSSISVTAPGTDNVRVDIMTPAGAVVRSFTGRSTYTWDGTDNEGGTVADGMYLCRATANGASSVMKIFKAQ